MKTKKTHQVVMLPTEKAEFLNGTKYIVSDGKQIDHIDGHLSPIYTPKGFKSQLICVISDESITEGLFYNEKLKRIDEIECFERSSGYAGYRCKSGTWIYEEEAKNKIMATSDRSITPIGWIPESFVKVYIKAYNEGKPITEVDLEMRTDFSEATKSQMVGFGDDPEDFTFIPVPKGREDGSVIIHQSKMYSREEVEDLIYRAMKSRNYTPLSEYREWLSENL